MKYDVFISHSSADIELSEKIYDYLQEQGIKCWIDSRNVTGPYAKSIMEGIEQSELMLLVYSSNVNSSPHVESEIDNAFCKGKTIIPFRIEGTPYSIALSYYLNKSHYIDGMPYPLDALDKLCDQIKRNLSEYKRFDTIEDSFKLIAEWASVDVEQIRDVLKDLKEKQLDVEFNRLLNEFIEREFAESSNDIGDGKAEEDLIDEKTGENGSQKGGYDILVNGVGGILIIVNYKETEPDNPRIVYDGMDTALVYRNGESAFLLENIALKARTDLMNVEEVLMVEIKDDKVAREYMVPMRKIENLQSLL